jgi:hypothetical protein
MANRLLRNIAVTIGAGLAVGLAKRPGGKPAHRPASHLNPILNRLDAIESRVARVELAPPQVTVPSPDEIDAIGTLVSSQSEDIESLRRQVYEIERRNAEQVEAFGQKLALMEQQVPMQIEARVAGQMADLEKRLRCEFESIHAKTVDAFTQTIEDRVIGRIHLLENSLVDQAQAITTLREKSYRTDENLQKLLTAVEKLCEKAETRSQVPIPPPPPQAAPQPEPAASTDESFAAYYRRAISTAGALLPARGPEPELAYAGAPGPAPASPVRREMKSFGLSLLGLAILGLRIIR